MTYQPTNREKKLKPKGGLFWCVACDAQLVRQWEKCPNCGCRNGPKKMKPKKY